MADERLLSFSVAESTYAVLANGVREVTRRPPLTRVPQGPDSLVGLMNFHGTAVPVVRMSALLGLPSRPDGNAARVVVYGESQPVGLLVDSVLNLDVATAQKGKRLDIAELLGRSFIAPAADRRPVEHLDVGPGPTKAAAEETVALLSFDVANQRFALPLEVVTEALTMPSGVAVMPRADDAVLGLLDWRGTVLPLVSLGGLLGLGATSGRANVLVVMLGDALVGLVCGTIVGVLRVPISAVEAVPPILQRGDGDAEIDAIARTGDKRSLVSILSPKKLFHNHDIVRAMDGANTGTIEMHASAPTVAMAQLVVFSLGDESFALPLGAVEEIVQLPDTLTRVPKAPAFVAGVMNLRGRALPVIDLRQRFQSSVAASSRPRVVVVATDQLQAGFIVDGVSEILRVEEGTISAAPAMPGGGARLFDRVTTGESGAVVLIVDPQELLDRAERDLLKSFRPVQGTQAST